MTSANSHQWTESLPSLDIGAMAPCSPELAGHENDAAREWVGDRRHVHRTDKQVLLDARRLKNAMEHLGRLPAKREATTSSPAEPIASGIS